MVNGHDDSLSLAGRQACSHFAQWLETKNVSGKTIFHSEPGPDHLVGGDNHRRGNPNEILAITACRATFDAYADLIAESPKAGRSYKILFGDIYTLSARILSVFDLVTLFHIREPECEARLMDDRRLVPLFLSRINAEGRLLFCKSEEAATALVSGFVKQRRMAIDQEYESLLVCRRTW